MVDMVERFIKYREKLSLLTHLALNSGDREQAFKIIDNWKKGKITYKEAIKKIKTLYM